MTRNQIHKLVKHTDSMRQSGPNTTLRFEWPEYPEGFVFDNYGRNDYRLNGEQFWYLDSLIAAYVNKVCDILGVRNE